MNLFNLLSEPIFGSFSFPTSIAGIIYGVFIFLSYVIGCYLLYGLTKSLSITYYKHCSAKYPLPFVKNLRWTFKIFMYLSALSLVVIVQNWWYLIVGLMFTFMAFFPSVNYKNYLIPHCIFALSGIALGLIGIPVTFGKSMVLIPLIAAIGDLLILTCCYQRPSDWDGKTDETTRLYWIEIYSISVMILGLLMCIIKFRM